MGSRKYFMGRAIGAACAASVAGMAVSMPVLAGTWKPDAAGWQYQNDDGSFAANGWEWIDGNGDGISESYYFNDAGYLLTNTTTPDGYQVNAEGAWVVDGQVETRAASGTSAQDTSSGVVQPEDIVGRWVECNAQGEPITKADAIAAGNVNVYVLDFTYDGSKPDAVIQMTYTGHGYDYDYIPSIISGTYSCVSEAGNALWFEKYFVYTTGGLAGSIKIEKNGDMITVLEEEVVKGEVEGLVGKRFIRSEDLPAGIRGFGTITS